MDDCARSSDQPEIVDPGEQGPRAEHSLWTNDSPNNTGVIESCGTWACETLGLFLGAKLRNVTNEKVEGSDLDNRQPDNSEELGSKHGSGRYFHLLHNWSAVFPWLECRADVVVLT